MNPIIIIPARLKATRLPDKPMADIAGKPMIVHVMERAIASNIGKVYVACDDQRIKEAVIEAGGFAVMTAKTHASGSDRIYEALQKIDPGKKCEVIINVQGDVPTIAPEIIRSVLLPLQDRTIDIATLACKITDETERNDPSVVKAVLGGIWGERAAPPSPTLTSSKGVAGSPALARTAGDGPPSTLATALYFSRATVPYGEGDHYHHIGIYAYRRAALERFVSLPPSTLEIREKLEQLRALEAGMKIGVAVVDTVPLGVDTPEHLQKARQIFGGEDYGI